MIVNWSRRQYHRAHQALMDSWIAVWIVGATTLDASHACLFYVPQRNTNRTIEPRRTTRTLLARKTVLEAPPC